MGDCFEIGVQNASLCVDGLSVPIIFRNRIKALGQFILSLGGETILVLEYHNMVRIERISDYLELLIYEVSTECRCEECGARTIQVFQVDSSNLCPEINV